MKRECEYCGEKLKAKELEAHVFEVHEGGGKGFKCFGEACTRCCTDEGAPLELTLRDIIRISKKLKMGFKEFFESYCSIAWSGNLRDGFVPTTVFPFPCKFLSSGKCAIYEARPLHCRLFPERLYISPSSQTVEPFYRAGYKCVDAGFKLTEERKGYIKELFKQDEEEINETLNFFENFTFFYTPEDGMYNIIVNKLKKISPADAERNAKKRKIIEASIPEDFKEEVKKHFIERLEELEE